MTMTLTPRLAIFTLIGILAYLGLAVLGSGGLIAFFSHPALIALAIATLAMSGVAFFVAETSARANARIVPTAGSL
jgi:hypothetical protein